MDMEDGRADDSARIKPPGKLRDGDWVQWELKSLLTNFLQNMVGPVSISLQNLPKLWFMTAPKWHDLHQRQMEGLWHHQAGGDWHPELLGLDDMIKSLNCTQDGRGSTTLLRTQFDRPGEVQKGIVYTYNTIKQLHYMKECIFPFSLYVKSLNTCYTTFGTR